MRKIDCFKCANLIPEAKTSFLRFDVFCKKNPCKFGLLTREKKGSFAKWKVKSKCDKFKAESTSPVDKCEGCGFIEKNKCRLHNYPVREWLKRLIGGKGNCFDYDKDPEENELRRTKTYKRWNKKFKCRFSEMEEMPVSSREEGVLCGLCEDRGGEVTCPISNAGSMGWFRSEVEQELGGKKDEGKRIEKKAGRV